MSLTQKDANRFADAILNGKAGATSLAKAMVDDSDANATVVYVAMYGRFTDADVDAKAKIKTIEQAVRMALRRMTIKKDADGNVTDPGKTIKRDDANRRVLLVPVESRTAGAGRKPTKDEGKDEAGKATATPEVTKENYENLCNQTAAAVAALLKTGTPQNAETLTRLIQRTMAENGVDITINKIEGLSREPQQWNAGTKDKPTIAEGRGVKGKTTEGSNDLQEAA